MSSINGSFALPLARRQMLDSVLNEEARAIKNNEPGLRMIDIFGIRYISSFDKVSTAGFTLLPSIEESPVRIYRNEAAKPRFQVYWNATQVDDAKQALINLQSAKKERLFIETLSSQKNSEGINSRGDLKLSPDEYEISVQEATSIRYRVNVKVSQDAWFFLADANYPGWRAYVNGIEQPVYSAQVLGKAVQLQAGENEVIIEYVPWSFSIGAFISLLTFIVLISIFIRESFRRRSDK
jgi:hypothetical protein